MKKYIPYIIILALAVALLFSIQRCSYVRNNAVVNMEAWNDSLTFFKNKVGTVTASINTLQVEKSDLKKMLLDRDKELAALAKPFAQVHTVVRAETKLQIDTLYIGYSEVAPCDFERVGSINDTWYSFNYKSTSGGFKIDSLIMPNTLTVITGTKRKWFLGKETVTADVSSSNPYVTVTGLKAVEVIMPVPWYKKWYVWLAAGAVGGLALAK